jgi:hypothetical protein
VQWLSSFSPSLTAASGGDHRDMSPLIAYGLLVADLYCLWLMLRALFR